MGSVQIKIEAEISAEMQTVWTAWTLPEHITQWNFASEDWCCPWATNELIQGGRYVARMEAKDGSFGFEFGGVYDEVIPLTRIAMTLGDGRKVTTTFQTTGSSTKVTTLFDAETQNSEDLQRDGWQSILNNFKRYVEML